MTDEISPPLTRNGDAEALAADDLPDDHLNVGHRIRDLRKDRGWTLSEAAEHFGIGRSTLAKVEADHMSPTLGLLQKIARGLDVDIPSLLAQRPGVPASGRRTVTPAGTGEISETEHHVHEVLCADLSRKRMLPMRSRIKARTRKTVPRWFQHEGEEFVYVLEGRITFMSEFYEPTELNAGDSIYLDGRMRHRLIAAGDKDAVVLFIITE